MKFPSVRLTVRHLLVAVAIAAVVFWSAILARRTLEYRRLAAHHEGICRTPRGEIQNLTGDLEAANRNGTAAPGLEDQIRMHKDALAEEERASALFRERTWRPWKTVRYR